MDYKLAWEVLKAAFLAQANEDKDRNSAPSIILTEMNRIERYLEEGAKRRTESILRVLKEDKDEEED